MYKDKSLQGANRELFKVFFGFIEVLGIAFLTALSVFLVVTLQPPGLFVILLGFLDMMMVCHFVTKIVGIATSGRVVVKYSVLFWFITVLGIILLAIFFLGLWWGGSGVRNVVTSLTGTQIGQIFVLFCLFGGTVFLSVGIGGVGERYFRSDQGAFSCIVAMVVPLCIFVLIFLIIARLTVTIQRAQSLKSRLTQ